MALGNKSADTNNWDTVSAVKFKDVNQAIVDQKSSPTSFSGKYTGLVNNYTIAGNFGNWSLSGGSGDLVHMQLPITSGTLTPDGGGSATNFGSGTATIEVKLSYIPQPTAANTNGQVNDLKVKTKTADPRRDPVASVESVTMDNPSEKKLESPLQSVLATWLNENLQDFNHVFAAVSIGSQAKNPRLQWMKPTKIGYAVETPVGAAIDDYVFGVLAMTEHRPGTNLAYQISPNAIPDGANSGFLINQERFISKIFMPGVYLLFKNASVNDFDTTDDGTTVVNISELTFNDFECPTNKSGSETKKITDAKIGTGNFKLTAFDSHLQVEFIDLNFTWETGYIVHLHYTGSNVMSVDSQNHFHMSEPSKPSLQVNVTKTTAEKWKELIDGIVIGVVFAVVGGMIGGALGEASEGAAGAAEEAATEAAEESTTDAMAFSMDGLADDEIPNLAEVNSDAESSASSEVEAESSGESYTSKFKGFFRRNWKKMMGFAIGGAIGVVVDKIPDILRTYAEEDLKHMPTLDDFADEAVDPVVWANSKAFKLVSLQLNRSLQLGLDVTYKN